MLIIQSEERADDQIKLSIFDLVTGISRVIQYPKSHNHCKLASSFGSLIS